VRSGRQSRAGRHRPAARRHPAISESTVWHFSIASDSISLNNLTLESCLRNGNPSDVSLVHFTDWQVGGEECRLSGERGKCNDVFSVREFRCALATTVNWDAKSFSRPERSIYSEAVLTSLVIRSRARSYFNIGNARVPTFGLCGTSRMRFDDKSALDWSRARVCAKNAISLVSRASPEILN